MYKGAIIVLPNDSREAAGDSLHGIGGINQLRIGGVYGNRWLASFDFVSVYHIVM